MAKFIFQLESVLKQRRAVERERQLIVAAAERERVTLEDQIRGYQAEISRERDELRDQLAGRTESALLDLRGVRFQVSSTLRIMTLAQQAVLKLAGVHRRIEAARAQLLEATTARKAVEKLRERRLEDWRDEQRKIEAAALDELAVMAASRRSEIVA